MSEPTTFLERIANQQSSFVLFGDRVYDIADRKGFPDTLNAAGLELALVPSLCYKDFEILYDNIQKSQIKDYCAAYIKRTIDGKLHGDDYIKKEQNRIRALKFIVHEVFPYMVSRKYDENNILIAELNGNRNAVDNDNEKTALEKARIEISRILEEKFGNGNNGNNEKEDYAEKIRTDLIRREKERLTDRPIVEKKYSLNDLGLENVENSVFGSIIAHQPLYVIEKKVFTLELVDDNEKINNSQMVFTLNNKKYIPSESHFPLSALNDELLERKKRIWNIDSIEKSKDAFETLKDIIKTEEITETQMKELAKLDEYDLGECGFMLRDQEYYVYNRLPKFATQDGRDINKYWPYPATRIAIKIGWSGNHPYTNENPIAIEKREFHPCLRNKQGEFNHICILDAKFDFTSLKDIVKKLSDSCKAFMEPLNKSSLERHKTHDEMGRDRYSYFGLMLEDVLTHGSLTKEQVIEQGYYIVNVIEKKADAVVEENNTPKQTNTAEEKKMETEKNTTAAEEQKEN